MLPDEASVIGIAEDFKTLAVVEEEHMLKVLTACAGNMARAARILGREPTQFGKLCRSKGWANTGVDLMEAE